MVKRATAPADETPFVPQIEDADVAPAVRLMPLCNGAAPPVSASPPFTHVDNDNEINHTMDVDAGVVAAAMKRARCLVALQGRCAAAYAELAPYVGATMYRARAELVDAAVELLLHLFEGKEAATGALGSSTHYGRELLAWLPGLFPLPSPKTSVGSAGGPSGKHCDTFRLALSRQQFYRLNSTELVQRTRAFVALGTSNAGPSVLIAVALVELLDAVCRPAGSSGCSFRRCLSVWRALRNTMALCFEKSSVATNSQRPSVTTPTSSSSLALTAALLQHVDLLMRCLELRDRPLESAARAYSREYARFDAAMALPKHAATTTTLAVAPEVEAHRQEEEAWKQCVAACVPFDASVAVGVTPLAAHDASSLPSLSQLPQHPQRVRDASDLLVQLLPALRSSPFACFFDLATADQSNSDGVNPTVLLQHLAARVATDDESDGTARVLPHNFSELLCRVWWTFLVGFVVAPVNDVFGQRRGPLHGSGGTVTTPRDDGRE